MGELRTDIFSPCPEDNSKKRKPLGRLDVQNSCLYLVDPDLCQVAWPEGTRERSMGLYMASGRTYFLTFLSTEARVEWIRAICRVAKPVRLYVLAAAFKAWLSDAEVKETVYPSLVYSDEEKGGFFDVFCEVADRGAQTIARQFESTLNQSITGSARTQCWRNLGNFLTSIIFKHCATGVFDEILFESLPQLTTLHIVSCDLMSLR